jgi:chromosome segregation ATPase
VAKNAERIEELEAQNQALQTRNEELEGVLETANQRTDELYGRIRQMEIDSRQRLRDLEFELRQRHQRELRALQHQLEVVNAKSVGRGDGAIEALKVALSITSSGNSAPSLEDLLGAAGGGGHPLGILLRRA